VQFRDFYGSNVDTPNYSRVLLVGDKSPFHSLALVLANKGRKLVRTPGCRRFDQAAKVSAL
jgi:hypothetical protein